MEKNWKFDWEVTELILRGGTVSEDYTITHKIEIDKLMDRYKTDNSEVLIQKVKRLSDGVEFKIGDLVEQTFSKNNDNFNIESIFLKNEEMWFSTDYRGLGVLENLERVNQIIKKEIDFQPGTRVKIPVGLLEFNVEGNTIWIQSPEGATTLRIKCKGKIRVDKCENSPVSHSDIIIDGDINFCLSKDAQT